MQLSELHCNRAENEQKRAIFGGCRGHFPAATAQNIFEVEFSLSKIFFYWCLVNAYKAMNHSRIANDKPRRLQRSLTFRRSSSARFATQRTYGGSRRCSGNSSIGLGGAAHKETNYFWGTSPKSELLSCFIPTAAAVGSCKASEQSSSDEKGDVSDVIYTLTDFYRTPMKLYEPP